MGSGRWTKEEERELRRLSLDGQLFNTEIAEKLGRPPATIGWKRRQLGVPSSQKTVRDRFGKWNSKHSHLRAPAMKYFLTHSFAETAKKFKLTTSELKSLMTVSYRDPKLRHLRKDTRRRDPWSTRELVFLLQHAGLRNRRWINSKLKRGNGTTVIKEKLQLLGIASRNLQGLTLSQFRQAFGEEPEFFLQSDAGPSRESVRAPTLWKIIPWVWLSAQLKARKLKTSPEMRILIHTHAMFQEWIFGGNALRKMERICAQAELPHVS